jgi:hypothetical protein
MRRCWALVAAGLLYADCRSGPDSPSELTPTPQPPIFDVQLVSTTPSSGATLDLASPNDTPVSLSVTFSVTVPPSQAGDYLWVTAVQTLNLYPPADYPIPVVTTSPTQTIALAVGTQIVTMTTFHTTNGLCDQVRAHPILVGTSASLDIQLKTATSITPFFGKQFPTTFGLRCL